MKSNFMQKSKSVLTPELAKAYDDVWLLRESGEYGDNLKTRKANLVLRELQHQDRVDNDYYNSHKTEEAFIDTVKEIQEMKVDINNLEKYYE